MANKAKIMEAFGIAVTYKDIADILDDGRTAKSIGVSVCNAHGGNIERFLIKNGICDEMTLRARMDAVEEKREANAKRLRDLHDALDAALQDALDGKFDETKVDETIDQAIDQTISEIANDEAPETAEKPIIEETVEEEKPMLIIEETVTEEPIQPAYPKQPDDKELLRKVNALIRSLSDPDLQFLDHYLFENAVRDLEELRGKNFMHLVRIDWDAVAAE